MEFCVDLDLMIITSAYPIGETTNIERYRELDKMYEKVMMEKTDIIKKTYTFRIGQRVKIIKGRKVGRSGVIKDIQKSGTDYSEYEYEIKLDGERLNRIYFDYNIEPEDIMEKEIFESVNPNTEDEDMNNIGDPKFKVGDVVEDSHNPDQSLSYPVYIIKESFPRVDEHFIQLGYNYEVAPINSPDESIILNEDVLSFQYHDKNWEEYFTEGAKQKKLPPWRGELYSYIRINDIKDPKYNDYTLPPIRMKHIIEKHSVRERIDVILDNVDFKESIAKKMHCSIDELTYIRKSIIDKINVINGKEDIEIIPKDNHGHRKVDFDYKEQRLISLVGYYDKYEHVNEKEETTESKDHYPAKMSDYSIMRAIKQAYENAVNIEKRKYGEKRRPTSPEGIVLFQGVSKDGLTIQFYYDFTKNRINTAYPVFVDTTNRPDLRHPDNKNKKRQN